MNYYPFHLGDYATDTAHLEPMEDLAYRRMLDLYYRTEKRLPASVEDIARLIRLRDHCEAIRVVLNEFFTACDDGWMHSRCEAEIGRMQDKQAKARASAKASADARSANAERTLNERSASAELPTPTPTPTPTPLAEKEPNGSVASGDAPKLPDCPHDEIVKLYHEALPDLPQVRLMSEPRRKALRAFWRWVLTSKKSDGTPRAVTTDQALTWIRGYFERAGQNDFLMGRTARHGEHANWQCDLDFLLTEKGKRHVIEKTKEAA